MINEQKGNSPMPASQPAMTNPNSIPKKSKLGLIIGIVVVVLLLAAGAGAGYYYYFYVNASPEKIFFQALENLKTLDSGTINYKVDVSVEFQGTKEVKVDSMILSMGTAQDFDFKANIDFNFKRQGKYIQTASQIDIEVPTGQEIPLLGEVTVSPQINLVFLEKDIIFLKIAGILPIPFIDLSAINDEWIKIDLMELEEEYGVKLRASDETNIQQDEEMSKKTINLYEQYSFMNLEDLGTDKVGSDSTYHYKLILDEEKFKEFYKKLFELYEEEGYVDNYQVNLERGLEGLDEALENTETSAEIWITKRSRLLRKVFFNVLLADEDYNFEVNSIVELTNYNQPVEIVEPTDFMTISETMEKIMQGSVGQMPAGQEPL